MATGRTSLSCDKDRIALNIARLKKGGETFEIDVDPDLAIDFKQGKLSDIKLVLKAEKIFTDPKKGLLASDNTMKAVFGTSDVLEVAKRILLEGEIQLTAEHRQKIRDAKRRRIVEIIRVNGVDPKTHLPHPLARLEAALDEAKVRIDEFLPEEKQVQEILDKLRPILPIRFETKQIELVVQANHASRLHNVIKTFGKFIKNEWRADGSWRCVIEIPAGMQDDFFDKVNAMTHGDVESKILESK